MQEGLREAGAKIDALVEAQHRARREKLASMTKPELQALADEQGIAGVDQRSQTEDEMVAVITQALGG
ncbi:MAG: hypothetical protein ACRDZ3_00370 [Acidimicrobiia bacterium]